MTECATYIRVSTEQQNYDNQLPAIKTWCETRGWWLVKIYAESAIGWTTGRQVGLTRCIRDAEYHHNDTIVCWSLDSVSREGPLRVSSLLDHLRRKGINVLNNGPLPTQNRN